VADLPKTGFSTSGGKGARLGTSGSLAITRAGRSETGGGPPGCSRNATGGTAGAGLSTGFLSDGGSAMERCTGAFAVSGCAGSESFDTRSGIARGGCRGDLAASVGGCVSPLLTGRVSMAGAAGAFRGGDGASSCGSSRQSSSSDQGERQEPCRGFHQFDFLGGGGLLSGLGGGMRVNYNCDYARPFQNWKPKSRAASAGVFALEKCASSSVRTSSAAQSPAPAISASNGCSANRPVASAASKKGSAAGA
jgi:hypothetical protein